MDNFNKLNNYIKAKNHYKSTYYFKVEKWVERELFKSYHDSFIQSTSQNQLICKKWLVEELLKVNLNTNAEGKYDIEIIGGWFGFPLLDILYDHYGDQLGKIDFYDVDEICHKVLWQYLNYSNFPLKINVFGDYFERKEKRRRQLVINTSQEHMDYVHLDWLKGNPVFALQSNNMTNLDEHINCVSSQDELQQKSGLEKVMYIGTKNLDEYDRYMIIGRHYD